MNNKKIAILVNGFHKPMGVFSKGYIEELKYDKVIIFGGLIPIFKLGTPKWKQFFVRYWLTILALKDDKKITKLKINRLAKILKEEKVDLALCEFLNTGASSLPACKKANVPMISNVLGYEINDNNVLKRFSTKYEELAKYQSYTVCVAKYMIEKLSEFGFPKNKTLYSPIGAANEFYELKPKLINQQFLAIGRFTETKAPQNTILAFHAVSKQHKTATLVMAGAGELLEDCKHLVMELNISDKVNFVGWINRSQQKKLLENSIAFVQHSVTAKNGDREGTPVAIIEASAAGLPVVSTIHAGIPDVITHGETGYLVDEHDWKNMAKYMSQIIEDRQTLMKMSVKTKEVSKANHSLTAHLSLISNLIDNTIKV